MSKRKITLLMTSMIVAIMLMIIPNISKAKEPTVPVYFGVTTIRENSATNAYNGHDAGKNIGYAIGNPQANGSEGTLRVGANIYNIMTYPNNNPGTTGTEGNYYCVREGEGFYSGTGGDKTFVQIKPYYNSFEIKLDNKNTITSNVGYLNGISDNDYKALIILSNLLYLGGTDAERIAFLDSVGINTDLTGEDAQYDVLLTESDIKAVQQAAIWYYSNRHGQTIANQWSTLYDNTSKPNWFNYTVDGESYSTIDAYDLGFTAQGQTGSGIDRQDQANILYRYLINTTNNMVATNATVEAKAKIVVYTSLDDQANTQPIIYIEKLPQEVREFDLALRKYITKVDDTEINTRIPNIDLTKIDTEKTAGYRHRKDPVVVKNGSKVIYNLTVYNEGEKAGRAIEIIDQLPEGLTFSRLVDSQGFTANYDSNLNRVTITRNSSNTTNLDAYTPNNLKSETIRVECTVTATASTQADKILTNVAWISKEYDAVDKVTIINQVGKDRDSEPSDAPSVNKSNMENYKGNSANQTNLADPNYHYKGQEDDDDFEKLILEKENENSYNIILVKEDADGEQLNSKATFQINNNPPVEFTGKVEIAKNVQINSTNVNTVDTYTIKELVPPDEYCRFDGIITIKVTKDLVDGVYKVVSMEYTVTDSKNNNIKGTEDDPVKVTLNANGNIYVNVKNYQFDLKLIKRITELNGEKVPERLQDVDITNLANGTATTAIYKMDKNPVAVKNGDIVKYTFRIYNEGDIDGYASEITENVPEGLEFIWSDKTDDSQIDADTSLSQLEKEAIKYNQARWSIETVNKNTNKAETISTDYLALKKGDELRTTCANLIKAFDKTKAYKNTINDKNPDYKEISVYLRVTAEDSTNTIIRNEACITEDTDKKGNPVDDRDSDTEQWKKEDDNKYYDEDKKWPVYKEDDEDYDNIILKSFDLALRKFIIAVSKDQNIEESEYLRNSDKTYQRAPKVDTSKLNTKDENGKLITTAIYEHTKEPVEVAKNDYVVYMFRVYNEGDIDGYASEIKDHLPPYLQYVDNEFNKGYGWSASEDGRTVTTKYLDNHKIEKATKNEDGKIVLSYKELPIMCKVTDNAEGKITNIADITVYKDENKKPANDRDSQINNVKLPEDKDLPNYKDNETGKYIPGQQDDDDFEKLIVKKFDLALRKFITAVDEEKVDSRYPKLSYDKDKNHITYTHPKEEAPVEVVTNNIVTYTIRVYNEGEIDGFASKVSDDIPDGLEYLPNNDLNKEYRWVMYDKDGKETDKVAEAVKITTDYLSKEQGEARMKDDDNIEENPALLKSFDREQGITDTNPDYADVKVAFKVTEPNGSSRVIVNSAQISDDTDKDGNPVDDKDSTPDKWNDGEDDQDKEYIKLNYFDLALRKWVTHAIVIENGKETVTPTGHKAEDNPEQVVKVELHRKKLSSLQVKFKYSIRVTNEGDIAGYAKEITDYVPAGLKFDAKDNPDWKDEGNNVISTTKLENKLLKPGESAEVQVTLTWINGQNNLGLKTNIAEISKDYNDKGVPDRDSTPDNKVPGEDDQDDAPVLLSISTGKAKTYIALSVVILVTIAGGIVLIKKFVL